MEKIEKINFSGFSYEKCIYCGDCFVNCPVLNLSTDSAIKEILTLVQHETEKSLVFSYCTTCSACNLFCPVDASPYELILENFNDRAEEKGLPFLAKLVFPDEEHNMWSMMKHLISDREKNLLKEWKENLNGEHETLILAGFYTNLIPYIADTEILGELKEHIAGYEGLFGSAGDMYKLGLLRKSYEAGSRMKYHLEKMKVKKVYAMMEPEAAMLKEVLPRRFGINYNFEIDTVDNLLYTWVKEGKIKLKRKLGLKVTVHDNCCSRYFSSYPQKLSREIVRITGCENYEMKHSRDKALCCGWAATIPTMYEKKFKISHTLFYLLYSLYVRLKEAEELKVDAIVTSCHACTLFLALIAELVDSPLKIYHIQELIQMAAGEDPPNLHGERAWDLLAIAVNLTVEWLKAPTTEKFFKPKETPPSGEIEVAASQEEIERTKKIRKTLEKIRKSTVARRNLAKIVRRTLDYYGKREVKKVSPMGEMIH